MKANETKEEHIVKQVYIAAQRERYYVGELVSFLHRAFSVTQGRTLGFLDHMQVGPYWVQPKDHVMNIIISMQIETAIDIN